jgi:hypothetical protein
MQDIAFARQALDARAFGVIENLLAISVATSSFGNLNNHSKARCVAARTVGDVHEQEEL